MKKIILCVDVEDERLNPSKSVWKALDRWSSKLNFQIEAVHLINYPKRMIHDFQILDRINKDLAKFVKKSNMTSCKKYHSIIGSPSIKEAVKKLIHFSVHGDFKAITVISHGRRWLNRFVMGSFSERLLAESPLPVLFLSRRGVSHDNKILFLTDFSKTSIIAFRYFIQQFGKMSEDIILYHAIEPVYAYTEFMFYPSESKNFAVSKIEEMTKIASEFNVKCRWIIEDSVYDLPKSVMKLMDKEKVSLIGMGTQSENFGYAFVGDLAKKIFRYEKVSAWICGPKAIKYSKNFLNKKVVSKDRLLSY